MPTKKNPIKEKYTKTQIVSEIAENTGLTRKQVNGVIEELGGVIPAIEAGYFQQEIAQSAYRYQREIDTRQRTVVGVNAFRSDEPLSIPLLRMDPEGYERHVARLNKLRRERDNKELKGRLEALRQAAEGTENVMPHILEAVRAYGTLGEICGVLREVFGEYREPVII